MSAIQSQIQTGTETLGFDITQRSLPTNIRTDGMLRQTGIPHLPQNVMNMNAQHFMQQQQAHGQQPLQQPPMGLLQNNQQPMGMLAGAQPNVGPSQANPNYQLQMQQQALRKQPMMMQHGQGLPHQGGMAPGMNGMVSSQMQNMGFPNAMMQQPQVPTAPIRRVISQPQGLNQGVAHMTPMHTGQQGPVGMGMNPQANLAHMRQHSQPGQQMGMRMPGQPQQPMSGPMNPEMAMRGHMSTSMSPGVARAPSAGAPLIPNGMQSQAMGQPHAAGLQQSLQNSFANPPPMNNLPHSQPIASSPPRPPSHQQNPMPGVMGGNMSVASQSVNRGPRVTPGPGPGGPDQMFMGMQNQGFPPNMQHNVPRIPQNNPQFPFAPSSTPQPPNQDLSQPMASGLAPPGPPGRPSFHPTPAQQYEQMQGTDAFSPHMNMGPPNTPARPPSQQQHMPQQHPQVPPQHHSPNRQSPHQPDPTNARISQPLRPQSQPQQVHHPTQPPVQRTPRMSQPPLPGNPAPAPQQPQRIQPGVQQHAVPQQVQQHQHQQAPQGQQPPQPGQMAQPPLTQAPLTGPNRPPIPPQNTGEQGHMRRTTVPGDHGSGVMPAPIRQPMMSYPIGSGQGFLKMAAFSLMLNTEHTEKTTYNFWERQINEHFGRKATFKFTLWKDNQRNEAKPFEIGIPILPRFFLVTHQSGVKAMQIAMDGARERLVNHTSAMVESQSATWSFRYGSGYIVTLRGVMLVVVSCAPGPANMPSYKIEQISFDAHFHDKVISLEYLFLNRMVMPNESPKTPRSRPPNQQREDERRIEDGIMVIDRQAMPPEPVNAFGIPQATMRCLELAESVSQMQDLINYSTENGLGPVEALKRYAQKLRETQGPTSGMPSTSQAIGPSSLHGDGSSTSSAFSHANGVAGPSSSTLYPPLGNPSNTQSTPSSLSQNPQPQGSPSKQSKVLQQATPTMSANTPVTHGTPTPANVTPSMAPATLKRKAGDTAPSSAGGSDNPPAAKRITRKRGRTNTGG
ncbi:hypothetical protein OE88DRAFT_1652902 [Heliocybe sulcata]|uniref:LIM-domain binding protein-domain-containing protein n=1 Tax=Heliocybe sulcata TaxID=5364 RepID=A0A5C3NFV2_9AGAM|nr:hypothetical protein OE88DRAFT_1652902 [Heliocybe sulcata]